ncbi:hydroxyisourate hydrolase [Pseudooceanicola algae]|uniref:5-hydroxyisourate hydrolase n=1 Tax=Pseudooceanicola algae TaxID=1537215 RepID=A0A418SB81_9RHOB|nr:hydroxyisourate hydrolase [Pseudooceanicola algae]QPM91330.1 5-hydroxyisourate hydrolase [Pseudooceanicola algae]
MSAGGISIHAVNVATGRPAEGLRVRLSRETAADRVLIAEGHCGKSGLFEDPSVEGAGIIAGRYVAEFFIGDFIATSSNATTEAAVGFLDVAVFPFILSDPAQHYHLPLKFTAWGYSLFRGGL